MKCPKCDGTYLEVFGSFMGSQKIEFSGESLEVVDSLPGDFEWGDDDQVCCLDCGHQESAVAFQEEDSSDGAES